MNWIGVVITESNAWFLLFGGFVGSVASGLIMWRKSFYQRAELEDAVVESCMAGTPTHGTDPGHEAPFESKVDRRFRVMGKAAHHREQLSALMLEFVDLHNEPMNSDEADELCTVIRDGIPYDEAMMRVMLCKQR